MDQHHETVKHVIDFGAVGAAAATLAGWLPSIAALLSIVWMLIRLYEWIERRIERHRKRKRSQHGDA